jgi:hypothetical protein
VGNTSKYGLPYPNLSDVPSGPAAVQTLAQSIDALGVIGGKRRVAVGSASSTIEATVIDTQTLALTGTSVFQIDYFLGFVVSVAGTDVSMKIRLTSVSGTIVDQTVALGVYVTPTINYGFLRTIYKTTAAELQYFAGTLVRTGTGTGTITPVMPTSLIVTNLGPSTIVGDF